MKFLLALSRKKPSPFLEGSLLLGFVILAQLAGVIGSLFTFSAIPTWYATLVRPSFAPPNWVFGPVWTTLYTLIGLSAFLVFRNRVKKMATQRIVWLRVFFIQLLLNTLWSIIFFGWQALGLAFVEILLLWSSIAWLIWRGKELSRFIPWLLTPYLLWVSFASVLNLAFWWLN